MRNLTWGFIPRTRKRAPEGDPAVAWGFIPRTPVPVLFLSAALTILTACSPTPPAPTSSSPTSVAPPASSPETAPVQAADALRRAPDSIFPHLRDDGDLASLRAAMEQSLDWLRRKRDREIVIGPRTVTAGALHDAYVEVLTLLDDEPDPDRLAAELAQRFELYESVGGPSGGMLITGYYEPLIEGCRIKTPECQVPVYGRPRDLGQLKTVDLGAFRDDLAGKKITGRIRGGRFVPYPDRREIRESGILRGGEIAWARDRVDLFFIEVQGSGALRFDDGGEMRIGYAGANGRAYRSIGKLLIDQGKVPRELMSMQAIRKYLREHPEEIDDVLDHNRSFVFFRKLDGAPLGSLGRPVTPGRSVALDHKIFPKAAMGFLVSETPAMNAAGETVAEAQLMRLVFSQDTGGAIKGAGRADFFWGRGEKAALRAGLMKQPGRLFFLVPRAQ